MKAKCTKIKTIYHNTRIAKLKHRKNNNYKYMSLCLCSYLDGVEGVAGDNSGDTGEQPCQVLLVSGSLPHLSRSLRIPLLRGTIYISDYHGELLPSKYPPILIRAKIYIYNNNNKYRNPRVISKPRQTSRINK